MASERERLEELRDDASSWRRWGCYVSERAWGTVREDYSVDGDAWNYLPHDLARSKAYRWGEDGIAGICDRYQFLVFAPAFWNHRDAILKERLFGLSNPEGNHGEDVKECYFHLDNTPTHSYMRYLYRYPQRAFPYEQLIERNRGRSGDDPEFELIDTGVFEENRFFDITIEYAKLDPEDLCMRIRATNCGPDTAPLDILPQLWLRNTWSWTRPPGRKPWIRVRTHSDHLAMLEVDGIDRRSEPTIRSDYQIGRRILYGSPGGCVLMTENETNTARVPGAHAIGGSRYVKDLFHDWVIRGYGKDSVPFRGTKAGIHYRTEVPAQGTVAWEFRLTDKGELDSPLAVVTETLQRRRDEADAFYAQLHPAHATADEMRIQRQAWAGLLWTKQSYLFDVAKWLDGEDPTKPPPASRHQLRNQHWRHLNSLRVMTVPDKWEYPWFAAWDLAFQCVAIAEVDPRFAMDQLQVMLFEQFQHANGQIPAYEWEFSDLNPPVHAWAVWRVYNRARLRWGITDRDFLERCFHKLLINFAWWVNKVDRSGNNIFEGGFLGLDNITVVDRSMPAPDGMVLEQSDATGWMGMFCLNLMRIALELAKENPAYEGLAIKFFQHYVYVAAAMKHLGGGEHGLWDEEDGFFYDRMSHRDGSACKFRVRSLVGLIPLFAVERLEQQWLERFQHFRENVQWFLANRSELTQGVVQSVKRNNQETLVLTIVNDGQLRRMLQRVIDPAEFLSDYGVRSLSKYHERHPFEFQGNQVGYEPGESRTRVKGGNSNWRGPIWLPTNYLLIESLTRLAKAWGSDFAIPRPGGSPATLGEVAQDLANRLIRIFTLDDRTRRPQLGSHPILQQDPAWRDLPLFYEYFHGDTGAGLGASHQTGWTALVASLVDQYRG